jgi:hypothetical protein
MPEKVYLIDLNDLKLGDALSDGSLHQVERQLKELTKENIDFKGKVAWIEGNMVRARAEGKKINPGKTETAERGVPLAGWLVDLLLDRRERVTDALPTREASDMLGHCRLSITTDT